MSDREKPLNESLSFIQHLGLSPVIANERSKAPHAKWNPATSTPARLDEARHVLNDQDKQWNLGALFSGPAVDIDVDTKDPFIQYALDFFLPKTTYVWGREGKPRSHRAYMCREDYDRAPHARILQFLKNFNPTEGIDLAIELRGGKREYNQYSLLPGSIHDTTGELYQWEGRIQTDVTPKPVEAHELVADIRLAVASSLLAHYWVEGSRNQLTMALAGMTCRISMLSAQFAGVEDTSVKGAEDTKIPADVGFILTEEMANSVFRCVMEMAGDDLSDMRAREKTWAATWKKLQNDPSARVTGATKLAEIMGQDGKKVVTALFRLLTDNDGLQAIEDLAKQFCLWYGPGVIIDLDMVQKGVDKTWMTREQARNSMGRHKVRIGEKLIPAVELLFTSSMITLVDGFTFEPNSPDMLYEKTPETPESKSTNWVNEWFGFTQREHQEPVTEEEVKPFIEYIRNTIANGDADAYEWVMAWLADMIQNPGDKPGTALVLVGVQGAGKSFLGECIMRPIIGRHAAQTNDITHLTQKFNTLFDNKIFIQCDEAIHSYQRHTAAVLKSLITDDKIKIEPKGINAYHKPNYIRYLFTSNEENSALFIDPSPHERRFTVLKVNKSRASDLKYWSTIRKWTSENLAMIMRYLKDYKYEKATIRRPLMTEAKKRMQVESMPPEVEWMLSKIREGQPIAEKFHTVWAYSFHTDHEASIPKSSNGIYREIWPNRIRRQSLIDDLNAFIRAKGGRVFSHNMNKVMGELVPGWNVVKPEQKRVTYSDHDKVINTSVRVFPFPTPTEILNHMVEIYGSILKEEIEDDQILRHVLQGGELESEAPTEDEHTEF